MSDGCCFRFEISNNHQCQDNKRRVLVEVGTLVCTREVIRFSECLNMQTEIMADSES